MIFSLNKDVRDIMKEMGETGAGLTAEDEVDMSIASTVTSVWSKSMNANSNNNNSPED
jgi:hypothetical protein